MKRRTLDTVTKLRKAERDSIRLKLSDLNAAERSATAARAGGESEIYSELAVVEPADEFGLPVWAFLVWIPHAHCRVADRRETEAAIRAEGRAVHAILLERQVELARIEALVDLQSQERASIALNVGINSLREVVLTPRVRT